jgi:hypothetical protein
MPTAIIDIYRSFSIERRAGAILGNLGDPGEIDTALHMA